VQDCLDCDYSNLYIKPQTQRLISISFLTEESFLPATTFYNIVPCDIASTTMKVINNDHNRTNTSNECKYSLLECETKTKSQSMTEAKQLLFHT